MTWLRWPADQWIADTGIRRLSPAKRGVLADLRCLAWVGGGLADDAADLAAQIRAPASLVRRLFDLGFFPVDHDGRRRDPEQEADRRRVAAIARKRVEAGRRGGRARSKQVPRAKHSAPTTSGVGPKRPRVTDPMVPVRRPADREARAAHLPSAAAVSSTTYGSGDNRRVKQTLRHERTNNVSPAFGGCAERPAADAESVSTEPPPIWFEMKAQLSSPAAPATIGSVRPGA